MPQVKDMRLTGRQKAGVLMVALGTDASSEVLRHLSQDEVEMITAEIARMKEVDPSVMQDVVDECRQRIETEDFAEPAGMDYARRLLGQAMGDEKAGEIIERLGQRPSIRPFDSLRSADAGQLAHYLRSEHPQTIALVVAHLPASTAGQVLSGLSAEAQGDVATRIATLEAAPPEVIQQIEQTIAEKLSTAGAQDGAAPGGAPALVEILNQVDRSTERAILEGLAAVNPDLASVVKGQMFSFEDIVGLDNRAVQAILREVEQEDLRLSLKGAGEDVRTVVFKNISERAAASLREDLEAMGPVRVRDVEAAQRNIVAVIRRLEEAGEVVIRRGGGDDDLIA